MGISSKTHKILWGKSGNKCSFPDCKIDLVMQKSETDDHSIVGEEAHIVGRSKNGPRGISKLEIEERDKYKNLILLCRVHHKLIDDQEQKYTVEILHQYKNKHEDWVRKNLSLKNISKNNNDNYLEYIDRLDNKSETIRNAAIIELGEISKNQNLQNKIIKILISHIREKTKLFENNINIYNFYKINLDIQSALNIIGKRKKQFDKDLNFDFRDLNFNGIVLENVDLSKMDFSGSQFVHSKITNSTLNNSILNCCDFRHSDLSNSSICNSKIGGCDFELSKLIDCDFSNSHLGNSKFKDLAFGNSIFLNTTLVSAEFINVNMSNVKNLNQNKLYWAYGNNTKLPQNFLLRKTPLISLNDGGKGYKNRKPVIYKIENEKETLALLLKKQ